MLNKRVIFDRRTGAPRSGYTIEVYAYSTGTSGTSGIALYTYTDHGNGEYSVNVTTSIRATLVITTPLGHVLATSDTNTRHIWLEGDNQVTDPPGSTP